jgi:diketogulonate reductase-like aldo/keto reductase
LFYRSCITFRLINRVYDSLYGDGEELLGKWFKRTGKRDQIFLATKFGFIKGSKTFEVDSSASYCKKACEGSLRRLGIDSIDLCEFIIYLPWLNTYCWRCPLIIMNVM